MKFNKETYSKLSEISRRCNLTDDDTLMLQKTKDYIIRTKADIKLLDSYVAFAKTMPMEPGEPVMNSDGKAFLIRSFTFDFNEHGEPYWNKVCCTDKKGQQVIFAINEVFPYTKTSKILYKKEKKNE